MAQRPHAFLTLHLCPAASVTAALGSRSHEGGKGSFTVPRLVAFTQETP